MKSISKIFLFLLCMSVFTIGSMPSFTKGSKVFGEEEIDVHGSVVSRALMRDINVHMTEILSAILRGDASTATKEAFEVRTIAGSIMGEFFPKDGQVGRKFKVSDKSVKDKFEKFVQIIRDNSQNILTSSAEGNFAEAYESFDTMLRQACLSCHKATRDEWLGQLSPKSD